MAHEDSIMNVAVLATDHLLTLQEQGVWWFTSDAAMVSRKNDVSSLRLFLYMMKRNDYDVMAVYSNLDDIMSWAPFLAASKKITYLPIVSTNDGTPAHMAPTDVITWAKEEWDIGLDLHQVHFFAMNTMWWAIYIARCVEGSVEAAEYVRGIAEAMEEMSVGDEEE